MTWTDDIEKMHQNYEIQLAIARANSPPHDSRAEAQGQPLPRGAIRHPRLKVDSLLRALLRKCHLVGNYFGGGEDFNTARDHLKTHEKSPKSLQKGVCRESIIELTC